MDKNIDNDVENLTHVATKEEELLKDMDKRPWAKSEFYHTESGFFVYSSIVSIEPDTKEVASAECIIVNCYFDLTFEFTKVDDDSVSIRIILKDIYGNTVAKLNGDSEADFTDCLYMIRDIFIKVLATIYKEYMRTMVGKNANDDKFVETTLLSLREWGYGIQSAIKKLLD